MSTNKTVIINSIMRRIAEADKESPIAVFSVDGELKAVFLNTVQTRFWFKTRAYRSVGIFTKHDNLEDVFNILYYG